MKRLILTAVALATATTLAAGPAWADPGLMGPQEARNIKVGDTFNTVQDICGPPACNPWLEDDYTYQGIHWKTYVYANTEGGQDEVEFIVHDDGSRHVKFVYVCGTYSYEYGFTHAKCAELL